MNEEEKQELVGPQQCSVEFFFSKKEGTGKTSVDEHIIQKSYMGRLVSGVVVVWRKWHLTWQELRGIWLQGVQGSPSHRTEFVGGWSGWQLPIQEYARG